MVRIQQLRRLCWMENNGDFMEDMGYGVESLDFAS